MQAPPAGSAQSATRSGRAGAGSPESGTGACHGSRGSGAAIACKASRRSPTRRANGPCADSTCDDSGRSAAADGLKAGMRPAEGRSPATPHA